MKVCPCDIMSKQHGSTQQFLEDIIINVLKYMQSCFSCRKLCFNFCRSANSSKKWSKFKFVICILIFIIVFVQMKFIPHRLTVFVPFKPNFLSQICMFFGRYSSSGIIHLVSLMILATLLGVSLVSHKMPSAGTKFIFNEKVFQPSGSLALMSYYLIRSIFYIVHILCN